MFRKIYLIAALALTSSIAMAQTGSLKGVINDAMSGESIPFANIVAEKNGNQIGGTTTDFDGNYTIKPLEPGTYTIKATFVGYGTVEVTGVIVSANKITFQDVKLQEGIAELLGYKNAKWIKPLLDIKPKERPVKNKYVVINIHSTAQMKYWNHPDGKRVRGTSPYWNELCRILRKNGLTPVVVEKNEFWGVNPYYNGLPKKSVKRVGMPLEEVVNYIQHAEFFIGLSSGLAWIAHGLGKKTAIIANFTNEDHEIPLDENNYKRITKKDVCHGCWNNPKYDLMSIYKDRNDTWDECPEHKDTKREFECHTSITPEQVFNEIEDWI